MSDLSTYTGRNLSVYFQSQRAGVDDRLTARLVDFINATTSALDVAIYDLTEPSVWADWPPWPLRG